MMKNKDVKEGGRFRTAKSAFKSAFLGTLKSVFT